MPAMLRRLGPDRVAGLVFVLLLHVAVLQALWSARMLPVPPALAPVFVDFIMPPAAPPPAEPVRLEKPRSAPARPAVLPPPPQQLLADATPAKPADAVAPRPEPVVAAAPPVPAVAAAAVSPAPAIAGPVRLSEELSLACPGRTPPTYPAHLRRRGVEGQVTVRVELDEQGGVAEARIDHSSGSEALDAAALAAVRQWRCQPAMRGGRPVRAVALQPFNFTLEGR